MSGNHISVSGTILLVTMLVVTMLVVTMSGNNMSDNHISMSDDTIPLVTVLVATIWVVTIWKKKYGNNICGNAIWAEPIWEITMWVATIWVAIIWVVTVWKVNMWLVNREDESTKFTNFTGCYCLPKALLTHTTNQTAAAMALSHSGSLVPGHFFLHHIVTSSNENIFRITGLCEGNPSVTGGFPSQRPVTQSSDVFFDLRLNKQSRCWWFQIPSRSLRCHCNEESGNTEITLMLFHLDVKSPDPDPYSLL